MKVPYTLDVPSTKSTISSLPLRKVCMHVQKEVRTDFRVLREATALIEAGFDVSIVDVEPVSTIPTEEDIKGVHAKHILRPSWFIPTRFKPWFLVKVAHMIVSSAIKLIQVHADVYHAHDANALPACYIAAVLLRKPLILDAHELPLDEPGMTKWHLLHMLATRVLALMLPRCAGVIATSPPTAQEMQKCYAIPKVTLVRNMPMYQNITKTDRLRQALGLGPEVKIALYQGYLQPDRGLDRLVHAAHFIAPNTIIVMMGKAVPTTQTHLETLITNGGLADRVKIIPEVPYGELLHWTSSADIGLAILPLDFSVAVQMMLPNKFFEYLMAGLPTLVSPLQAIAEIVESYDVGSVLSSLEPENVADAINTLLDDTTSLTRMSQNALTIARKEFHWEKERNQLIELYRDILVIRQED